MSGRQSGGDQNFRQQGAIGRWYRYSSPARQDGSLPFVELGMPKMAAADKTAELCWGQRYIWLRHHQLPAEARHETHIVTSFPLPPGAPLIGVRTMLNYLVRRHEALRTTYHCDGEGGPWQ